MNKPSYKLLAQAYLFCAGVPMELIEHTDLSELEALAENNPEDLTLYELAVKVIEAGNSTYYK